jgi:GntR family transcriptional regulator
VQELERRLLVRRYRGVGTFVSKRLDYVVGGNHPPSWHETIRSVGATPREHTESMTVVRDPDPSMREALALRPGEAVVALSRLRYVDDELAGCSEVLLNAALLPGIENKLEPTASIYRYLHDHYHLEPYRGWSEVSMEIPPADVAEQLGASAQPLYFLHQSRIDSRSLGRPIEHVTAWLRPEVVRVRVVYGDPHPEQEPHSQP